MLSQISLIAAQTKIEADRFIQLGADANRVKVTGNIKFDLEIPADLNEKSSVLRKQLGDRLIWIAASTHPGEDEIVLAAHRLVLNRFPNALLILVPRHPERFDAVADVVKQQGFNVVRRSTHQPCDISTQVYLGDSMGEMMLMYSVSDVAFVGGSFVPVGGHNMLEPAALTKPIITGPYVFNFTEVSELLFKAKGMVKVENANQLAEAVIQFFSDSELRQTTGVNAKSVVDNNRGAVAKQVQLAAELFPSP